MLQDRDKFHKTRVVFIAISYPSFHPVTGGNSLNIQNDKSLPDEIPPSC